MLIFEYRPAFVEEILHKIAADLQLTEPQHKKAEVRYHAIGDVLRGNGSILAAFSPSISPQGSLLLGTTLRPDAKREYDLDLLCCLAIDFRKIQRPSVLLEWTESVLRSHGTYETMLERKRFSRCVRVRYRDEFHLDIVPCCPDGGNGAIWLPDRDAEEWRPGNPKSYAGWFQLRARVTMLEVMAKAIDPLPGYEPAERKSPLQRVVQLLKRWRDVVFRDDPHAAPSSIVLTTLAALHYRGEASVYDALSRVLAGIVAALPETGRLEVRNPVDLREDLSEAWETNQGAYRKFAERIIKLEEQWRALRGIDGQDQISNRLAQLFDSGSPGLVLKAQAAAVNRLKQSSALRVRSSGHLTVASTPGAILDPPGRHFGGKIHR
jgi:hypothetical protein